MNATAKQAREIFLAAVRLSPDGWPAYLADACGGDDELRRRVTKLLHAHQEAGSFLAPDAPPPDVTVDSPIREQAGTVVGPYRLMEQIGEGGMGLVFVAEQQRPVRRKVALKLIKPGMDTRQVVARFEAERQALALMDHPHIAKVLDGGETDSGRPYFVMELVRGVPITEYCDQQHVPVRARLGLFLHVCQAVQHAHQKGIIHRDLKPSNVLVMSQDGTPVVKVIDFGIAKAVGQQLTDKTIYTQFAQLVGTPLYMSPEQAGHSGVDVDTRTDIYALGVLLYELLTGTTPFDKERLRQAGYEEIRRIICEEEPPRPSTRISTLGEAASTVSTNRKSDPKQLRRLCRGELDWIVMKALEKDRNRRYETASGFARDVERYLADEPVQACPPSVGYRLRKLVRRHKGPVVAVSLVLLALVAGMVGTTLGLLEARAGAEAEAAQRLRAEDNAKLAIAVLDEIILKEVRQRLARYTLDRAKGLARDAERDKLEHEFLEKGLRFYEQLARTNATDWAARRQRANAYANVGLLQVDLGNLAEAENAYRHAIHLMEELAGERPEDFDNAYELANTYFSLAWPYWETRRLQTMEEVTRHALALFEKLAADFPGHRSKAEVAMALCQHRLADVLQAAGRLPESEKAFQTAITFWEVRVAEFREVPVDRAELAWNYDGLGQILQATGRVTDAEKAYRRALAIWGKVGTDLPERVFALRDGARLHGALAGLLAAAKRTREAEDAYRQAQANWEKLAAEFPGDPSYQNALTSIYGQLAAALKKDARPEEAQHILRRAVTFFEQLVAAQPKQPDPRDGLARSHYNLAELLQEIGQKKAAVEAFRQAIANWEKLAEDFPARPEYWRHASSTHEPLAALLNNEGRAAEAIQILQQRVKSCAALVARVPDKAESRDRLRHAYQALGRVLESCGRHDEAIAALSQAATVAEDQVRDLPDDRAFHLHDAHVELAAIFITARRYREGEKFYSEAIQRKPDDAMLWLRRAEFYSRLSLWDLAAKDSATAFKLSTSGTSIQCYTHALLSIYVGDLDSYRQLRARLPKQFPLNQDYGAGDDHLSRACTIMAVPEADFVAWAVQRAKKCVKSDPDGYSSYFALGHAYFRAGKYEQAVAPLEGSLKMDPNWHGGGPCYPVLAMVYHQLGQRAKAQETLAAADRVIDRLLEVLSRGPAGTLPTGWWEGWLESYLLYREAKTLIDGAPPADDPRWFVARANAFAALGEHKRALEAYGQAIKLRPDDPMLRLARAEYYLRSGSLDLPAKDAAELLKLEDAQAPAKAESRERWQKAHHALAVALRAAGRHEEAARSLSRAAAIVEKLVCDFPHDAAYADQLFQVHRELASAFIADRRCGAGEKLYREAVKLRPDDAMPRLRRAEFYGRLGLWDLAAGDSAAAAKLQPPATPNLCLNHAVLCLYAGDLAAYRALCAGIPKRFGADTDYRGWDAELPRALTVGAAVKADLVAWAVQRAERCVQRDPAPPWNHCALGRAYFRAGAYDKAVTQLTRSLEIDPKWNAGAMSYPVVAMAYHRMGQADKAKEALEKATRAMDQLSDGLSPGPAGPLLPTIFWNNWLECCFLYREAKTVVDGAPPADDPRWYVARAAAFVALGDQQKAGEAYRKAVALGATADERSRLIKGYIDLAWHLIQANPRRLTEAEAVCRDGIATVEDMIARFPQAAQHRRERADLQCALGWAFQHGGQPAEAVKCFRQEIDLREALPAEFGITPGQRRELSGTYTALGLALRAAAGPKEAIAPHRRALELAEVLLGEFPQEARYQWRLVACHTNLGVLLRQTDQVDEAEGHFRKVIAFFEAHPGLEDPDGTLVTSLFGLTQILSKKGREEEAAKAYRRLVELQPASPSANNNAAWFLATGPDPKFRDPGRAVVLAKKATELGANEGTYWNTLGAAQYRAGDWQAAIAALEKSMGLRQGGDGFDWFFLAMAHRRLGATEKARAYFDRAVQWMDQHQPADEELRRFRGEAAALLGIQP